MGMQGGGMGGGGRSVFVNNVCPSHLSRQSALLTFLQIPYTVGWQDLKDLFRQGGEQPLKFHHAQSHANSS
jgi:hypothetical protein